MGSEIGVPNKSFSPSYSWFNHSCSYNAEMVVPKSELACDVEMKAVKTIQKGEEVCVCYSPDAGRDGGMVCHTASAPSWYTQHDENSYAYRRFSTNRMSHNPKIEVLAAKTGYTDTARSCFTTVFRKNGRTLAITTLGAYSSSRRWKDVRKLTNWAMRN